MTTPFPEIHAEAVWKKYLEQRLRLEARQGSPISPRSLKITRKTVYLEARRAAALIALEAGTKTDPSDGVLVVHGEYINTHRDTTGKVFSRIYLPHSLTIIEVGFYHHKVRGNSREPHPKYDGCALGYRYVLVNEEPYTQAMVRTLFTRSMRKMFLPERNGFTPIYYGNQRKGRPDNDNDWNGSKGSTGIEGDDLDELAHILSLKSAPKSGGWQARAEMRALACRFLLAAATVDPGVKKTGEVDDQIPINAVGPFPWILGGDSHWFAKKVAFWCRGRAGNINKWKDSVEVRNVRG